MSLSFPPSPSVNDTYTAEARTWRWTGAVWELFGGPVIPDDSVTTVKIQDGAVTAVKVASGVAASNLGFTPASTGKSIAMSIVFGGG